VLGERPPRREVDKREPRDAAFVHRTGRESVVWVVGLLRQLARVIDSVSIGFPPEEGFRVVDFPLRRQCVAFEQRVDRCDSRVDLYLSGRGRGCSHYGTRRAPTRADAQAFALPPPRRCQPRVAAVIPRAHVRGFAPGRPRTRPGVQHWTQAWAAEDSPSLVRASPKSSLSMDAVLSGPP
jgi:hypothetical protein